MKLLIYVGTKHFKWVHVDGSLDRCLNGVTVSNLSKSKCKKIEINNLQVVICKVSRPGIEPDPRHEQHNKKLTTRAEWGAYMTRRLK